MNIANFCSSIEDQNKEDPMETKFSICYYDKQVCELLLFFEEQLLKIQKITNPIKRKHLNDGLFYFIQRLRSFDPDVVLHQLVFLQNKTCYIHNLDSNQLALIRDFHMMNPFYKNQSYFMLDFFMDYFDNLQFVLYIECSKNKTKLILCTKHKFLKYVKHLSLPDDIQNEINYWKQKYDLKCVLIYGNDFKNRNIPIYLLDATLENHTQIIEYIHRKTISDNLEILQSRLHDIEKNENVKLDLYVFGKLKTIIQENIENYMLKELFIQSNKSVRLKQIVDPSFLNFKIYDIESLEKGDIGDRFIRDYNGIMGVKYYC